MPSLVHGMQKHKRVRKSRYHIMKKKIIVAVVVVVVILAAIAIISVLAQTPALI